MIALIFLPPAKGCLYNNRQWSREVLDDMDTARKSYIPEFRLNVVLENMQRDTTQEAVCKQFCGRSADGLVRGIDREYVCRTIRRRLGAQPVRLFSP